ncbi:MAG: PhoH family protein [Halarsenatibacteraceae bacterium]
MAKKIFLIDTNVLLMNPRAIYSFEDNDVIIPMAVLEEIDDQKNKSSDLGYNARETSRILESLRELGRLDEGVKLEEGGVVRIVINGHTRELPENINLDKMDNRIINAALNLKKTSDKEVILVSNDINLRLIADAFGLKAEMHKADRLSDEDLYTGYAQCEVSSEMIDQFYQNENLKIEDLNSEIDFHPNEFINLTTPGEGSKQSALGIIEKDRLVKLRNEKRSALGIKPLNREQTMAIELLLRDEVELITLAGKAGTGKTLLALAAGLEKVLSEKKYNRILVARPVVPMGKDIGFLPGTKEDKLQPWMQPIFDNLDYILKQNKSSDITFNKLIENDKIQIEPLTYIRGRSVPDQYIIIDEAQNLSKHEVKTIITRVGKNSKIVLTGDPFQIDNPFLDKQNNGLSYLAYRLREIDITGHIMLEKGERSELARIASEML